MRFPGKLSRLIQPENADVGALAVPLVGALRLAKRSFLLGGSGWDDKPMPPNLRRVGHVGTGDHNAFNTSSLAVLNIARDSMSEVGF